MPDADDGTDGEDRRAQAAFAGKRFPPGRSLRTALRVRLDMNISCMPGRTRRPWTASRPAWQRHSHMARRQVSHFKVQPLHRGAGEVVLAPRCLGGLSLRTAEFYSGPSRARFSALALCRMFSRCSKHGPGQDDRRILRAVVCRWTSECFSSDVREQPAGGLQVWCPTNRRAAGTDSRAKEKKQMSVLRTVTTAVFSLALVGVAF